MNIGLVTILIVFSILKFIRTSRKTFIFNTIALNKFNILLIDGDINLVNDLHIYYKQKI